MIIQRYADFRGIFALPGADIDIDGFEVFPVAKLRSGGFTGLTLVSSPANEVPFIVTCNAQAVDGGAAFDWWLSQRTDDPTKQYLLITQAAANKSGTVSITFAPTGSPPFRVSQLLPEVTDPIEFLEAGNRKLIYKNCHLYVQRRSDKAYQWMTLDVG